MFQYKDQSIHFQTKIPLVDEIYVHFVVTEDIRQAHDEFKLYFDPSCAGYGGEAHMEDKAMDVFVFMNKDQLTYEMIGHEIYHALNHICNRIGYKPDPENDEMAARISGYMHGWVYHKLIWAGLSVKEKSPNLRSLTNRKKILELKHEFCDTRN